MPNYLGSKESEFTFAQLKPQFGEKIQLEIRSPSKRFSLQLVGYLPDKSLIVSTGGNGSALSHYMSEKRHVTARLMTGNYIVGFNAQVVKLGEAPLDYLYLSYPQSIEARRVRQHNRVPINMLVSVDADEDSDSGMAWPISALSTDISLNGACVESADVLAKLNEVRYVTAKFNVDTLEYVLLLKCRLRNVEKVTSGQEGEHLQRYRHGFSFEDLSDESKLVISGFVYQQFLVETGHLSPLLR